MLRTLLFIAATCAVVFIRPLHAQHLRGQSFESVLEHPLRRDSIRLWHRYLTDSSLVLLLPKGANPWLQRSYELHIPIGKVTNPVYIQAVSTSPDSLTISCTASDHFNNGYRVHFYRERGNFRFCYVDEFQLFRSGVERLCQVRARTLDKTDRRVIIPVAGSGGCRYVYHRQVLASYPNCFY